MTRINLRLKFGKVTFFGMMSKTQTLKGIGSCIDKKNHLHYIFWDLDSCTRKEAEKTLADVQREFGLGMIFITSDKKGSYRAWCFSIRKWLEYLHILLHTKYVDYGFWIWTVRRGEATLRISKKEERDMYKILTLSQGYEKTSTPQILRFIEYDTGTEKKGMLVTNYR